MYISEIDRDFCREMTKSGLSRELDKIKNNYMKIYDEYYSDNSTRDSAFLKDLVDSLKGISAVLEVYVEHKGIHPQAKRELQHRHPDLRCLQRGVLQRHRQHSAYGRTRSRRDRAGGLCAVCGASGRRDPGN